MTSITARGFNAKFPILVGLAVCSVLFILRDSIVLETSILSTTSPRNSSSNGKDTELASGTQDSCLGLDFEDDFDKLLSKYKQTFVLMTPKTAGTSLHSFTRTCMTSKNTTAFFDTPRNNPLNYPHLHLLDEILISELNMPTLISSHIYNADPLHSLLKYATDDSLIVLTYRNENERVLSAIKQVVTSRACEHPEVYPEIASGLTVIDGECHLKERSLLELIRIKRGSEVWQSNPAILTCDTYEIIKDNNPNVVLINYKQVNELQKLLNKNHCPEIEIPASRKNADDNKISPLIILEGQKNNGTLVPLEDWLYGKRTLIEMLFDTKKDISCQATTRAMEKKLFSCSSKTIQISGESHDGHTIQFSL